MTALRFPRRVHGPVAIALLVIGMLLAACGDDASPTTTGTTSEPQATTSATTPATTTAVETTTPPSTTAAPPTTMAGEPFDLFPMVGAELAVVGVEHDDVLNVRAGPGMGSAVIGTIPPTGSATSLGEARLLPQSIWWKVEVEGMTGWISSSFTAQEGLTDDVTSRVVDLLGEIPTAPDMVQLGAIVAGELSAEDPPSQITVTVDATVGDLGEITYDVVGLQDDSQRGYRLHVFGEPIETGFSLKSVEATIMCDPVRGVTDEGFCV